MSIPDMYTFIYITVIIRKLQRAIIFTISGLTPHLKCSSKFEIFDHPSPKNDEIWQNQEILSYF